MTSRPGIAILLTVILFIAYCDPNEDTPVDDPREVFIKEGSYLGEYWPTTGWRECAPANVGLDPDRLSAVFDYAVNPRINTHAVLRLTRTSLSDSPSHRETVPKTASGVPSSLGPIPDKPQDPESRHGSCGS